MGQKLGTRGGEAAMMAYFKQRAPQAMPRQHCLGNHGVLDGRFGVAFEHDRGCFISYAHHERIVVGGNRARLIVAKRGEDGYLCVAERERVAGAERTHADVEIGGLMEQGVVGAEDGVVPDP